MGHIIIGIIVILVGVFFVVKTEKILGIFGRMRFFERYLSTSGGSRVGYKLLGVIILFFGFVTLFGWINDLMLVILSPFLKYN